MNPGISRFVGSLYQPPWITVVELSKNQYPFQFVFEEDALTQAKYARRDEKDPKWIRMIHHLLNFIFLEPTLARVVGTGRGKW